jgi:predicted glycosyltransferase
MRVMIVVTHLLGSGHLSRALVLARAFADAGDEPVLVSGGMPTAHLDTSGLRFVQLPPVRSDGVNFTTLLDEASAPTTPTYMQARKTALIQCLEDYAPHALITELFPFGRRILGEEFTALLSAARQRKALPALLASVRDILAPPSKPAKAEMVRNIIATFYDGVLVHSHEATIPLSASWPVDAEIAGKLRYTGFVAPPPVTPHPDALGRDEVLITTGGGSVGDALFDTSLKAASLAPTVTWRLLVGGAQAERRIKTFKERAPDNAHVVPASANFRQMLYHARASVSFCGYNTALDILQAGTPSVFVPFDDGGEVEQTLRARTLEALPGITVLNQKDLSPERLLSCLEIVRKAPRRPPGIPGPDGAKQSVALVRKAVAEVQT